MPGTDSLREFFFATYPFTEALTGQDRQFNFRHIEPTAMFGRQMNLQFLRQTPCFFGRKRSIQGGRYVRVQLVHHQDDLLSIGIINVDQITNKVCPVYPRSSLRHC